MTYLIVGVASLWVYAVIGLWVVRPSEADDGGDGGDSAVLRLVWPAVLTCREIGRAWRWVRHVSYDRWV